MRGAAAAVRFGPWKGSTEIYWTFQKSTEIWRLTQFHCKKVQVLQAVECEKPALPRTRISRLGCSHSAVLIWAGRQLTRREIRSFGSKAVELVGQSCDFDSVWLYDLTNFDCKFSSISILLAVNTVEIEVRWWSWALELPDEADEDCDNPFWHQEQIWR